ncbi:DUF3883 domain-containing protein [Shewanella sp.]|uniref:sacsin N-terminal ATP-binding-like domain-containing protein n=1 Tax=Shewanella sp. TaxID=50422 RepID=UPI001ED7CBAD|nr:DUF3883 domain-containing protein [Shewanella sp.]NRB25766.1 DUF3883 domain-containing protein [Shewanella sp.]
MSQKAELLAFRKDKYQLEESTGRSLLQEDAKSDLHNSVNIISEQLYSKDVHFVFELIQNAEDNHYADGVTPKLHFELLEEDPTGTEGTNGCLAIFNNETGFNIKNIKAISSIGKSTKAGCKDAGYIGEKGIGFKSVFSVSPSPHIFSNGYHFLFKDKDDVAGLGYIIPYWVDNTPAIVQERLSTYTTCILLPLRADSERDIQQKIRHELNNLDASILLFLNKLNELTVKVDGKLRRYSKQVDGKVTTLVNQQGNSSVSADYLVSRKSVDVPSTLIEAKREGVVKRDLCIAFRKGLKPEQKTNHKLYAYLPTELNTGLPFLVNADFLLPASRESVLVDKKWNHWIRDEVAIFAADTLAELLLENDNVDYFSQIPHLDNCNEDFLLPIFEKIIEVLKQTAFIPSLSGLKNLPSDICFADKEVTNLLAELKSDEAKLPDRVIAVDTHPYKKLLKQWRDCHLDAEEILSYLNAAQVALTDLPESWFVSLLRWLSRRDDKFHWKVNEDGLELLRIAPLFVTNQGVLSCHEQLLFLSSNTHIEYPILTTPEHKTNHGLISASFQKLLQKEAGTLSFVKEYFDIETLSQGEYLEKVALPFCEEHWQDIEPESLWKLNSFVAQHWFSINDYAKSLLNENLPFKNQAGDFELKGKRQLVTPEDDERSFIWQAVFNKDEQNHFLILSNDYLELFEKFEKLDKDGFYSTIGISSTPLPEIVKVTKQYRHGAIQLTESYFTESYESYLCNKIDQIDSTGVISAECYKLPAICHTPNVFLNEELRKAFFYWLAEVEGKLLGSVFIRYFYRTNYRKVVESELLRWLKQTKWLPTQNGLKRPEETFVASQGSRELYGDAVSFLDSDFSLPMSLAERLGVASEVNTETVLKVLRSWSFHNEKVSIDDVMKLYDRLADTGSDLETLFASESLIYCPSGERNWCKSNKAIWKSQKEVLGDLFHWLSDVYPDYRMSFWLNTINVSQHPVPKSFADAWLLLQTLPVKDKDKGRHVRNKLAAIYERLISYIKMRGSNNLEPWFDEFVDKALCFSQSYRWVSRFSCYIRDDKRVALLFNDKAEFFWRTRGKTHSDFMPLHDALRLKGVSEEVYREVELDTENLIPPSNPILTNHSRLLLAYYYKQFISKSGTVAEDWFKKPEIFDLLTVNEFCTSSDIPVKYELNGRLAHDSVEVLFDDEKGILVYNTEGKDIEDLVDDLAEEISKLIVTKAFIEEQDHIRPLLNVNSARRFNKRIEKKHWENVLTKEEIRIIKSLKRPEVESDLSSMSDTEANEEGTATDKGSSNGASPSTGTGRANGSGSSVGAGSAHSAGSGTGVGSSNGAGSGKRAGSSNGSGTGTGRSNGSGAGSSNSSSTGTDRSNGSGSSTGDGSCVGEDNNDTPSRSPNYRMVSYVENSDHQSNDDNEPAKKQRAKKIGDKAEAIVAQYLQQEGLDVEHLGGNNPGFDIYATDPKTGETFLVEVKGMLGNWNLMGFTLSSTQMRKCQDYGDNYWLIVVENLVSKPYLYKLINPAAQIDIYCFDSNWKQVAEESIALNITNDSIELRPPSIFSDGEDDIIDDDFFYCDKHKELYLKCSEFAIGTPDVGFELQDPYAEIVFELELAWPKHKKGIYTAEQKPSFDGWEFKTVEEALTELSWLDI